jgi:hypothetical protein
MLHVICYIGRCCLVNKTVSSQHRAAKPTGTVSSIQTNGWISTAVCNALECIRSKAEFFEIHAWIKLCECMELSCIDCGLVFVAPSSDSSATLRRSLQCHD